MNSDEDFLHRYLNSTRWDCVSVIGSEVESAARFAAKGFPGIDVGCTFVTIRSKSRRCQFISVGSSTFVVLDLELSDRLMELDLLVQLSAMKSDWVYSFFTVMLGDVFRQQRDFERYRYCVLKAKGDVNSLQGLAALPKQGLSIRASLAPVVFHELAHLAYRRNLSLVSPIREWCSAALNKFASLSEEQAATGRQPIPGGTTVGKPFEDYDQDRLKNQLNLYAATIRNNDELVEELTCDVISALALLNLESGMDCFDPVVPKALPLSVRQLGDIYYLAIKTSRYLQIMAGIQQFGANVSKGSDDLHRTIIEMTARTNALTHVLLNIFRAQIETFQFNEHPSFGRALSNDQIMRAMHRSVAHLIQQHHDNLLGPFENLSDFFLAKEAYEEDNQAVLAGICGPSLDTIEAIDVVRKQLSL